MGWGFGLGGGFGLGFGKHPLGLVDGPGLHIQGVCFPGGHGFPLGQPFGGPCGFPAIISINKITITIFTIMSINYGRMAESHFGQNDTLARDTLAKTIWPD